MKGKNITIDQLAVMVNKGFEGTNKRMDLGFKKVNDRLDRIENILLEKHSEEIKSLKDRVKVLEEALAVE